MILFPSAVDAAGSKKITAERTEINEKDTRAFLC